MSSTTSTTTTPYASSSPQQNVDQPVMKRYQRIGGFEMPHDIAAKWLARKLHKGVSELTTAEYDMAVGSLWTAIQPYGWAVIPTGEPSPRNPNGGRSLKRSHFILVTRRAPFKAYKGFPISGIPQFVPDEMEERAEKFLASQNMDRLEYEFRTVILPIDYDDD